MPHIHKRTNMQTEVLCTHSPTESMALFGFNFTNSVEHMACSFRVDPLFNCTFVPVSSVLFYLSCIPVVRVEIPFSFLAFSLPSVSALCSCLHPYLLPVSAVLSSDPTLSRLLSCSFLLVCVCVCSQKTVFVSHSVPRARYVSLSPSGNQGKERHSLDRFKGYFSPFPNSKEKKN